MDNLLIKQAKNFIDSEDTLSAMCNIIALLYEKLDIVNWVGYYLYKDGKLILGPFQGKTACSEIAIGKGVCGTSYQKRMLLNVFDVTRFDGHIVCDTDSCSELVVPLIYENEIYGVIDIDSPVYRRFGTNEEDTIDTIAKMIAKKIYENKRKIKNI